ncbi:hypothetical protein AB0F72_08570 [Actinoplanes sp. NPDC023936]
MSLPRLLWRSFLAVAPWVLALVAVLAVGLAGLALLGLAEVEVSVR